MSAQAVQGLGAHQGRGNVLRLRAPCRKGRLIGAENRCQILLPRGFTAILRFNGLAGLFEKSR
jgi:hypothetical protein